MVFEMGSEMIVARVMDRTTSSLWIVDTKVSCSQWTIYQAQQHVNTGFQEMADSNTAILNVSSRRHCPAVLCPPCVRFRQ